MNFSKAFIFVALTMSGGSLFGQELKGRSSILRTPFQSRNSQFNLSSNIPNLNLDLVDEAPAALRASGLDARYGLRQKFFQGLSLSDDRQIETISYGFDLDNIPICDLEVKVHKSLDGLTSVIGDIPNLPARSFQETDWQSPDKIAKTVVETLLVSSMGANYNLVSSAKCLWSKTDELRPAWQQIIAVNGLEYEIITNGDEVFRFDPRFFQETGSAEVYPDNINEGSPEVISLADMDSSGFLSNSSFEICMPSVTGSNACVSSKTAPVLPFAQEPNFQFNYDAKDEANKYIQTAIFTHANIALEWITNHGYANFGNSKIQLMAHAKFSGDSNNALYQPGGGTRLPMILVGDGDGNILQNLGTDADVVSHEFGHHIIFSTVTQISGESLVIHEAMADYFTFARTGNACLGESVCPNTTVGRQVCVVPVQCLRTGENDLAYGAKNLPTEPHQTGQFISGMLWDLYKKDRLALDDVTHLVLKAIDLLVSNSGYKHLVVALLLADHSEYQGKYCAKILSRAKVRGLGTILSDVSCDNIALTPASPGKVDGPAVNSTLPASVPAATVASKKAKTSSCGVLGGVLDGAGSEAGLALLMGLPFAVLGLRRRDCDKR